MQQASRGLASVSLDLDDLWTYLRTHGDDSWASRPSFLQEFVPLLLDLLDETQVKLTVFVVGADAAMPRNAPLLRAIVERGHELGNHSFEHEPWFHRYPRDRIEAEVVRTQDAVAQCTGQRVIGFRGPGYSWCADLLEVLVERGYLYDASTLPTYLGPLARAYYFWRSGLDRAERARRKALFGTLRDGTLPVRPYRWQLANGGMLLEIPVSTLPGLKLPFHLTYVHYLSRVSERLAFGYLRSALALCRATRMSPSFILHPLDLLGADHVPQLGFFPAMDLPSARKRGILSRGLHEYQRSFSLVPMSVHAQALADEARLVVRRPEPVPAQAVAG
ncbi:MAG: polysaccharide deacetylase family protein, partial [Gemmatimonadales bacterium]